MTVVVEINMFSILKLSAIFSLRDRVVSLSPRLIITLERVVDAIVFKTTTYTRKTLFVTNRTCEQFSYQLEKDKRC